jgi:NADPH2:quinone reductase
MMKAQVINHFGDPSVFEYKEIAKPVVKSGFVLIKVSATSVNPIDTKIRSGAVQYAAPSFPAILHGDVAGVVVEIGEGVKNLKVGDAVFGYAGGVRGTGGALAEYMLVDAQTVVKKPAEFSLREAAAVPLVAITAWISLFTKAQLKAGQHVLVHGGVGGVGHMGVQLAKWCGAKVYTTVLKNEDVAIVKRLGADEVIQAKEEGVSDYVQRLTQGRGFDVVFDTVGRTNLDNSLLAAAENGVVVTTAARSTHDLTPLHNKALSLHGVSVLLPLLNAEFAELGHALSKIAEIIAQGKLKPLLDTRLFNLENAAAAHALLESGQANGKIVIEI